MRNDHFFQVLFNDHYILIRFCIGNKWINKMFHFITAFGDSLSWKRNKLPKTTRSQQNDTTTEADCKLSERIKNCETFSVFSSPELKAQVSYSDRPLSVVRLSVCLSVCLSVRLSVNFYIFDFFSRTTGPILTKLGTNHPWGERIINCSNEGDCPSPRGDNHKRVKIH